MKDLDKLTEAFARILSVYICSHRLRTQPKGAIMSIFVFGSNLAGRHGKGAALHALQTHGAIYGQGRGLQGNAYAIPTKDERIRTRPLSAIAPDVATFIEFAAAHPDLHFNVTRIGCGLAGYTDDKMAPLFRAHTIPTNVTLPDGW